LFKDAMPVNPAHGGDRISSANFLAISISINVHAFFVADMGVAQHVLPKSNIVSH